MKWKEFLLLLDQSFKRKQQKQKRRSRNSKYKEKSQTKHTCRYHPKKKQSRRLEKKPFLDSALAAVEDLKNKKSDLAVVKSFVKPAQLIVEVMEEVFLLCGKSPD